MIIGEGLVFLVILGTGVFYIIRGLRRELRIAKLQGNFLLAVSHELRSPIAAMKLYMQTLQKRDLDEEHKEKILADILVNTERLSDLTDNIMTALRIEDESLDLQLEEHDLVPITVKLLDVQKRTIGEIHEIKTTMPSEAFAKVDIDAYKSILINLFENAVKYTPEGGTIHVNLGSDNETKLVIQDSGAGIDPKEHDQIFRRFYRAGNEETRSTQGTGLGLYIVSSLCKAMGGRVELSSSLGNGSTFAAIFRK